MPEARRAARRRGNFLLLKNFVGAVPYHTMILKIMSSTCPMHKNFGIGILNWFGPKQLLLANGDALVILRSGKEKQRALIRALYEASVWQGPLHMYLQGGLGRA